MKMHNIVLDTIFLLELKKNELFHDDLINFNNKLFYTKEQEPSITFKQTRVFLLSSIRSIFGYKVSNLLLKKIVWWGGAIRHLSSCGVEVAESFKELEKGL